MKIIKLLILNFLVITISYSQFYYPLSIGNFWDYDYDYHDTKITDTVIYNGIKYYVFSSGYQPRLKYQRQVGNKVYEIHPTVNQEILLFDFDKKNGDTVSIIALPNSNDTIIIFARGSRYENIFGHSRLTKNFLVDYIHYIDDEMYYDVADSFGITGIYGMWDWAELKGAIIDSVRYGSQITSCFDAVIPKDFLLHHNYPNPFNPSTTIRYDIPENGHMELSVHDILGREVATLVNEKREAGRYEVEFNGSKLTSGVYFYRLVVSSSKAGSNVLTGKMILIK